MTFCKERTWTGFGGFFFFFSLGFFNYNKKEVESSLTEAFVNHDEREKLLSFISVTENLDMHKTRVLSAQKDQLL